MAITVEVFCSSLISGILPSKDGPAAVIKALVTGFNIGSERKRQM